MKKPDEMTLEEFLSLSFEQVVKWAQENPLIFEAIKEQVDGIPTYGK